MQVHGAGLSIIAVVQRKHDFGQAVRGLIWSHYQNITLMCGSLPIKAFISSLQNQFHNLPLPVGCAIVWRTHGWVQVKLYVACVLLTVTVSEVVGYSPVIAFQTTLMSARTVAV